MMEDDDDMTEVEETLEDDEKHDECPDGFSNDAEYYRWKNG
jgi:hypothetical protein